MPAAPFPARGQPAPWRQRITLLLALAILIPSLLGFGDKFLEFVRLFRGEADGAFAIAPIVNYLLASGGFFLLLLWAVAHGMFRDIEGPKHTLLETERRLDAAPPARHASPPADRPAALPLTSRETSDE